MQDQETDIQITFYVSSKEIPITQSKQDLFNSIYTVQAVNLQDVVEEVK